jgi:tetratricopeptide (TPR) repeat protein
MWFNVRKFIVLYRLPIAGALIALGVWMTIDVKNGVYTSWLFFLIAVLMIVAHFMIGPITLIQRYVEGGDVDGAKALLGKVKFPKLLYKPIRSAYYMLKSQFSTINEDYDAAETDIRQSLKAGIKEKGMEGTAYLQLGSIAFKKGDKKGAYTNMRKAVELGLPDKETEATAYLQLAGICADRKDFRGAKHYFKRAKQLKPKGKMLVDQIKEMDKYMSRIPG